MLALASAGDAVANAAVGAGEAMMRILLFSLLRFGDAADAAAAAAAAAAGDACVGAGGE